jgi:hypothetical protein
MLIFIQGDEEKRQGIQPQSLMDRSLEDELPKNQVIRKESMLYSTSTSYLESNTDLTFMRNTAGHYNICRFSNLLIIRCRSTYL